MTISCSEPTETERLQSARDYLQSGEVKSAELELKTILQVNENSHLARLLLGRLSFDAGDHQRAEKELRRAQQLGVSSDEVLPLLAKSLLLQGKYDDVISLPVTALVGDSRAEVLSAKGLAHFGGGRLSQASELIDQAIAIAPNSAYSLLARARLLFLSDTQLARDQLNTIIQMDPEFLSVWGLMGDIEASEKNFKLADQAYSRLLDRQPDNYLTLMRRANSLIQLGDYVRAQKDIQRVIKKYPRHVGVNYIQGLIHFQRENFPDAESAFARAINDIEQYPLSLYYLGIINFLQGDKIQAKYYADKFFSHDSDSPLSRKLLATIKLKDFKYEEAEALIRPVVLKSANDVYAIDVLANSLMKQGKTKQGVEILAQQLAMDPSSPKALTRLGGSLLDNGDAAQGIKYLTKALQLDPHYAQADQLLILHHLKQQDFEQAEAAVTNYMQRNPDTFGPYNMLGLVYLRANRYADATKAFLQVRKLEAGEPYAHQYLAYLALRNNNPDLARQYYREVLSQHEDYLPVLLKIADLAELQGDAESMVGYLRVAITQHPEALAAWIKLASYYLQQGAPEQVMFLLDGLTEKQKIDPAVLKLIALSQLAREEFASAEFTLNRLVALQPELASAHYHLARAYGGTAQSDKVKLELETALRLDAQHFPARLALAKLFQREKNQAKFNEQLQVLEKLAPEQPDVLALKAASLLSNGDQQKALELAQQAFLSQPTTSGVLFIARLKWAMGDREGALQASTLWLQEHPDDSQVRLALANSYAASDRSHEAMQEYLKLIEQDRNNIVALNNLAWAMRDTEPKQALEYAERARSIKPDSGAVLDTLAVVLLKNGEIDKARRTIERALGKISKSQSVRYHSAMIHASAGDSATALHTLSNLLSEPGEFTERDEANSLLARLQSGD